MVEQFDSIEHVRARTYLEVIEEAREQMVNINARRPIGEQQQLKARFFVIRKMLEKIEELHEEHPDDEGVEEDYRRAVIVRDEMRQDVLGNYPDHKLIR